jgi:flagellar basal-body rod protein FlgB
MSFDLFGTTFTLLSKVLDLRSQRHTIITSNIANAETPQYRSVHLDFEEQLRRVLPSGNQLRLTTTNPGHVPAYGDIGAVQPRAEHENTQVQRADGNTVDLEKEVVRMSQNQLMYDAASQIIKRKFEGLTNVMKDAK